VLRNRLRVAEARDAGLEAELRALVDEAFGAGLLPSDQVASREQAIADLRAAAGARLSGPTDGMDDLGAERVLALQEEQTAARRELRSLIQERGALRTMAVDEGAYGAAVARQQTAMSSLGLVKDRDVSRDGSVGGHGDCPACGQELTTPDPTLQEMDDFARRLRADLAGLAGNAPRRAAAVARVESRIRELRDRIAAADTAIAALRAPSAGGLFRTSRAEEHAFHRGRIHASLSGLDASAHGAVEKARQDLQAAERAQARLESLAGENESDLDVRLVQIGQSLTGYAARLDVEHSDQPVTLDPRHLTVVVTAASGRLRLNQVGSAANYLGLHVAAHLALHGFLVEHDRPVPRFLMLDQPSQPFYPEDDPGAGTGELPAKSSDRAAVRRLYRLLYDFAEDNDFQIVVSDHVNLRDEPWFQDSIVEVWRDGEALVPAHWQARATEDDEPTAAEDGPDETGVDDDQRP
jgi:hypothetical protein